MFTYSLLFKQSKSGSTFSIAKMENGEGATIIKQTMEKIMFQVYCFLEKDRSCVGGGFQQLLRHSNVDSNVDWLFRSKRRGTSEASNCFNYSTGKGRDKEKTGLTRTRTRPNWARKVRELTLFNVLCTVYCGRGCLSLESEGKEIMRGCVNFCCGQRATTGRKPEVF